MVRWIHSLLAVGLISIGCGDEVPARPLEISHADVSSETQVPDIVETDILGDEVMECGLLPSGTYRGPCFVEYGPDSISTLCDEHTHRCVSPSAHCVGGWCLIPARSFQGGATDEAQWYNLESEPRSIMNVPRSFLMMETEVTFAKFNTLVGYLPDTDLRCGDDCPVSGVNIFEAMNFANVLGAREGLPACYELSGCSFRNAVWDGLSANVFACEQSKFVGPGCMGYRLPSGREYELAARAGSPYCLSRGRLDRSPSPNDCGPRDTKSWPHRLATFCGDSGSTTACPMVCFVDSDESAARCAAIPFVAATSGTVCLSPQPVRSKSANPFGLFGMHGNVGEWTQSSRDWVLNDLFGPVSSEPSTSIAATPEFQTVVDKDTYMLTAGAGYWNNIGTNCGHSLFLTRESLAKIAKLQLYGFRLVRTLAE